MRRSRAIWFTLPLIVSGCWGQSTGAPPPAVPAAPGQAATASAASAEPMPAPTAIWGTSYDRSLDTAKRQNLMVLADFTGSDWCPWCISASPRGLRDARVQDLGRDEGRPPRG